MERRAVGLATAFFVVAAVLVPVLVVVGQPLPPGTEWSQLVVRLLIVMYSASRLAQFFSRAQPRWFALFFWSFCYVWMGLAGLVQTAADVDPFGRPIDSNWDFWSGCLILLGMGCWDVVYTMRARRPDPGELDRPRLLTQSAAAVVVVVSLASTYSLLMRQGGLSTYLQTRSEVLEQLSIQVGSDGSLAAVGIVRSLTQVPPFVALLCVALVWRCYPSVRKSPSWWVLAGLTVATNLLVNNPVGSSRYWFATVALGTALTFPFFSSPRGVRLFTAALVLSLGVLFPYGDYFRSPEYRVERQTITSFMASKLDYDASAQVSNGLQRVHQQGLENGRQLTGSAGLLVPRAIWPEKPYPTGGLIAEYTRFHFTNLSAPIWIEGYIDFGVVGAAAFLALCGLAAAAGDRRIIRGWRQPSIDVLLLAPLAVYSMILLRGSLQATLSQGLAFVFAVAAVALLSRVLSGPPGRSASSRSQVPARTGAA